MVQDQTPGTKKGLYSGICLTGDVLKDVANQLQLVVSVKRSTLGMIVQRETVWAFLRYVHRLFYLL